FFVGRLIAPAAAGMIERSGGSMEARVQPRIEGAILLAMVGAALTGPLAGLASPVTALHGLLLMLAGALAITRLLRWQLWRCSARPDLICLGIGYSWLGLGLIVLGLSRGFDFGLARPAATHAITIGALGTLTTCIMLRTRLLRLRHELTRFGPAFMTMTGLIGLATLARLLLADSAAGLLLAATAWMLALGLLFVLLSRYRQRFQPG
ncbi:MAG TPA: NnrS family protein, partial [Wenzhouxiangella sp.]|nr:NnrS family protein [Wenzhouxiangella sp.]